MTDEERIEALLSERRQLCAEAKANRLEAMRLKKENAKMKKWIEVVRRQLPEALLQKAWAQFTEETRDWSR